MLKSSPCLVLACAVSGSFSASALTTVSDALVVTEFFEEFRLVVPGAPTSPAVFESPANPAGPGKPTHLLLESAGTLLFTQGEFLRRYNPATGIVTEVAQPTDSRIDSIAIEGDGNVIGITDRDVYRINAMTGDATLFPNLETFYSPRHVTVAPNGDIYINEFYDKFLKIDPVTMQFSQVSYQNNLGADYGIAMGFEALPDGDLAVVTFDKQIHRLDPITGLSSLVPIEFEFSTVRGTSISSTGQLLLATLDTVYEIDMQTGIGTILSPVPDIPFFSPNDVVQGSMTLLLDIDGDGDFDDADLGDAFGNYTGPVGALGGKTLADGDIDGDGDVDDADLGELFSLYIGPTAPVPEPTSLALLVLGGLALARRRRC